MVLECKIMKKSRKIIVLDLFNSFKLEEKCQEATQSFSDVFRGIWYLQNCIKRKFRIAKTSICHSCSIFSCSIRFSKDFYWFRYGDAKTQKIMINRCFRYPKLLFYTVLQISNVSKYIRQALCCFLALFFEFEAIK